MFVINVRLPMDSEKQNALKIASDDECIRQLMTEYIDIFLSEVMRLPYDCGRFNHSIKLIQDVFTFLG